MPKKNRTAKQKAASRRNLAKARRSRTYYHHTDASSLKPIGTLHVSDKINGVAADFGKNVFKMKIPRKALRRDEKQSGSSFLPGIHATNDTWHKVPAKALRGTRIRKGLK